MLKNYMEAQEFPWFPSPKPGSIVGKYLQIFQITSGVKFGNFCVISLSITHEIWAPKSLYNYCCKSVQLRCLQSSWVYLWLYVGFPLKWKRVWGFKWALFLSGRSSSRRSLRIVAWTIVACTIVLFI